MSGREKVLLPLRRALLYPHESSSSLTLCQTREGYEAERARGGGQGEQAIPFRSGDATAARGLGARGRVMGGVQWVEGPEGL